MLQQLEFQKGKTLQDLYTLQYAASRNLLQHLKRKEKLCKLEDYNLILFYATDMTG